MDKAALELGHITMNWARLEGALDDFIALLAPLEDGAVTHVITGNADMRSKLQIMKGLGYLRQFDADWFADLIFMLDHIDNDLRVRRNGVIHAEWFLPSGQLLRQTRKTKLFKPQSRSVAL